MDHLFESESSHAIFQSRISFYHHTPHVEYIIINTDVAHTDKIKKLNTIGIENFVCIFPESLICKLQETEAVWVNGVGSQFTPE